MGGWQQLSFRRILGSGGSIVILTSLSLPWNVTYCIFFYFFLDHMYIEEYIEDDEEPPLLLSSCPPHSKCVHFSVKSSFHVERLGQNWRLLTDRKPPVCVRPEGSGLWRDRSAAVPLGGRLCVSAVSCWTGAVQGQTMSQGGKHLRNSCLNSKNIILYD